MCFAPQRRALFRDLSFQKRSEPLVFLTFWLRNVLRATTACTFSTSQLPKVVRPWCALYILTWKCALRHNGVHFFDIATSKSGPKLVCFVHFDLSGVVNRVAIWFYYRKAFATAFAVLSRAQFWLSRRDFFRNIFRGGFRGKYSS